MKGGRIWESEVVWLIKGFKQPVQDSRLYQSIFQAKYWP
jgi:hypothetical protein